MADKTIEKLYPDMDVIYYNNQRIISSKNIKSKAVLFIHGSPGSSAQFLLTEIPRRILKETNYSTIIIDRYGYGYSDYGKIVLSIEESANKIANCLTQFPQVKSLIIIGYSYGGAIAAYISTLTSIKVSSLILISASAKPGAEKIYWFNYLLTRRVFAKIIPHAWKYANSEKLTHSFQLNAIKSIWQRVTTKVICVHGSNDKLIYPENAIFIKENSTSSQKTKLQLIDAIGHDILWKHSNLVLTLVKNENE
jgi:pimeloyl-ACP methyl ester carboxylesterase